MKKTKQLVIALIGVLISIMLAFGYSFWVGQNEAQKRAEYVKTNREFLSNLHSRLDEISDALQLADALPRENLPESIAKLQTLRQLVSKTPLPDCFDSWKKLEAVEERVRIMMIYLRYDERQNFLKDRWESDKALADLKSTLERECGGSRLLELSFKQDQKGT